MNNDAPRHSPVIAPERAARMIAEHGTECAAQLPLCRAVAARRVRLITHIRGTLIRPSLLRVRVPTVVIVGDDDDASSGPMGWRQAGLLLDWAGNAILHGAGAEAEHYELAVALAPFGHLLVETSTAFLDAWMDCARRTRTPSIAIRAPAGLPHPKPGKAGGGSA